ncbi:MAG: alpha/beta fold hydrolase [Chloroflexi bacterium]|nr:alpha/beta fold hydrolase [Chloroflexota bacterium]
MSSHVQFPGEAVEVFYFGAPDQPLYGVFHQPAANVRSCAIVLCPPIEQEYIRCHRAYRQLAVRLARAGFPTLRFDYYGTGDSSGDEAVMGLDVWLDNVGAAMEEAKSRGGASRVALVGLRLGAALALMAARGRPDVAAVALWEPVVSGREYLNELMAWHQEKLRYFLSNIVMDSGQKPTELLGFAITDRMFESLTSLNLLGEGQKLSNPVYIVEAEPDTLVNQLRQQLANRSTEVTYQNADGPRVWTDDPDKALVPNQVLEAIVNWVSGMC